MVTVLSECMRKAQKPHTCFYCGKRINKGEKYFVSTQIDDGVFSTFKMHKNCCDIAQEIIDFCDADDGMSDDEFKEGCGEICRTFICPDCEYYDKEDCECLKNESYCINKLSDFFKENVLVMERTKIGCIWKAEKIKQ